MRIFRYTFCLFILVTFTAPVFAAPMHSIANRDIVFVVNNEMWWDDTSMDLDKDGIHDAIWKAIDSTQHDWVDDEGRIGVIVDFDHSPTLDDELMLDDEVDFVHFFTYHLIDSIAGSVAVTDIEKLSKLPGVVMVELDGIMKIANSDVKDTHGVWGVYEDTGYDGAGSSVAIIDTGIDGAHVGLDDQDDDNSTYDPKIIAFYDVVNNPGLTNGTEVFPYDDQGHGSHCAGTTAGTGAPTYEHTGVAPQANLVGVKVLDEGGSGSFSGVMMGMEWTVEKRHEFNIRAASMSLGGFGIIELGSSEEESVSRMANEMVRSGIALFIAAGNNGVSGQIGTPGSAEDVITVGALDKGDDPGIAVYSSQGPVYGEDGFTVIRVKPNVAFVGSNVISVESNSGSGYTDMSGTSMATPGAAGVAALMYQANPELSPFDVRNIMQETAEYRPCHHAAANEPCAEDFTSLKPRQNNVYGHGEVRALPAVMEAANQVYGLDTNMNISVNANLGEYNRIHIFPGESIEFSATSSPSTVQWRTWDLRDEWMDIPDYEDGSEEISLSHTLIVDRLEYLPGNPIEGNQTLLLRSIKGNNASTISTVQIHVIGDSASSFESKSGNSAFLIAILVSIIVVLLSALATSIVMLQKMSGNSLSNLLWNKDEIEEAVLVEK